MQNAGSRSRHRLEGSALRSMSIAKRHPRPQRDQPIFQRPSQGNAPALPRDDDVEKAARPEVCGSSEPDQRQGRVAFPSETKCSPRVRNRWMPMTGGGSAFMTGSTSCSRSGQYCARKGCYDGTDARLSMKYHQRLGSITSLSVCQVARTRFDRSRPLRCRPTWGILAAV
jgi:hypothetical protein